MINPSDSKSLDRLGRAVDRSRWLLQPFREHRLTLLRSFVGSHYSYSGANQRVPLNLLQLAANIYLRQLVPHAAQAMVSSQSPALKPVAADFEAWMKKAIVGMRLGESLRICALNALFSLGIMKIGEAHVGDILVQGVTQHVGQPFAESVDLDDWVHDMTAKRFDQVQYCGNRYRVPLDEAKNNPLFDPDTRAKLSPQTRYAFNERGDMRTTTLSQSTQQNYDEYEDHVELWDLWLPREKLVLTMPYSESVEGGFMGMKPLRVVQWQGPQLGPFRILSYCDVPNNVMPAAPMQALLDMHDLVNLMWRKLARQAERQKTILGVMGSATDDAERINRSNDGEAVRVDFPDRAKEMSFGGMNREAMAGVMQAKDLFVYMAGNLDSLGGLSPQAQTLGQDELLSKNASAQIAEMQDRTIGFTRDVYQSIAFHWWSNPVLTYTATRDVAGMDIPVSITPQMRQTPYEALDIDIDPYSMQNATPSSRLSATMQLVQQFLLPAAPLMAQQGITLKWAELLNIIAKLGNMPDLSSIMAQGPPPEMQGAMEGAQQAAQQHAPAVTSRTNVRVNRPGMTDHGHSQMMQQLLSGGGTPQQAGMVGR